MISHFAAMTVMLASASLAKVPEVPADALARRERSNAVMVAEHVPVNATLPTIESEAVVSLPSTESVVMRAVATIVVAMKGEGADPVRTERIIKDYRLGPWLTPHERAFLADPHPDARALIASSWRYEAANTLLWSVGLVDALAAPREACDVSKLVALIESTPRATLLSRARLRPVAAVLDQDDLIYRYRWALDDARLNGLPAPAGLNGDVAVERQHALNWLVLHADEAWDDVSVDT